MIFELSQIPKGTVDLPRKWPEYSNNQDLYPPRVMIALQRSSENMKYTISIHNKITGECKFTLVSPKLVTGEAKGWSYPHIACYRHYNTNIIIIHSRQRTVRR